TERRRLAGRQTARDDVRVGADSAAARRAGLARVLQAAARARAGCGLAGHRLRTGGRGPCALRADRESPPLAAGATLDQGVSARPATPARAVRGSVTRQPSP